MKHFPFKGYKAMSWCGYIIHRIGTSDMDNKTVTHGTIHLDQAEKSGSWIEYYWQHLIEWLKGIVNPASSAYYTNPFEMQAYANEDKPEYPEGMIIYEDNYSDNEFNRYIIRNGRKKIYKNAGGTPRDWKEYVKHI
nr:MAG TPA: hypothetical protein [Crassvirales sp.]